MMRIILASKSPRRKELLSKIVNKFEIIQSNFDEKTIKEKDPAKLVELLSKAKGEDVFLKVQPNNNFIIIASDTLVFLNEELLGKPKTKEEAFTMLKKLQSHKHTVYTGLFVLINKNEKRKEFLTHSKTDVFFKKLTDKEILDYIESENTLDKAGGYAIQGKAKAFVEKTKGNIETVIGLDIEKLRGILGTVLNSSLKKGEF